MNELIQINERLIGDDTIQAVNARDLHAFLEVGKDFSTWVRDRIEQYKFVENQDFGIFPEIGENSERGGRPSKEYAISLDMAKELAMVERNDKGKQARLYFIECERRLKASAPDLSNALEDPAKLRTILLVYTERVIALEAKVQEQAPKTKFHDAVTEAINCQTVQEVAKVLRTGPTRMFEFLRKEKLLMRNNLPYQKYLDAGYFRVIQKQFDDKRRESQIYTRTLVTGKGLAYIQQRIQNQDIFVQEACA
jgi:anti-repressor protein